MLSTRHNSEEPIPFFNTLSMIIYLSLSLSKKTIKIAV